MASVLVFRLSNTATMLQFSNIAWIPPKKKPREPRTSCRFIDFVFLTSTKNGKQNSYAHYDSCTKLKSSTLATRRTPLRGKKIVRDTPPPPQQRIVFLVFEKQ